MRGLVRRKELCRVGSWSRRCEERGLDPDRAYKAEWSRWNPEGSGYESIDVFTPSGELFYGGLVSYFERVIKSDKTLEDFL